MKTVSSKDETRIAYDTSGDGPPLIYVTGALCYRNFMPVENDVKIFSQNFTVYNYDRRGRGDSGDTLPYAVKREVEDIEALIDEIGESVYLYGHSSGACLALEAAMALEEKVKKLAMYEAPYNPNEDAQESSDEFVKEIEQLLKADKRGEAVAYFMRGLGMPSEMLEHVKQSPNWPILESLAPTIAYDNAISSIVVPTDRAARLTIPTLVMCGESSYSFMKPVAEALSIAIPNSQFKPFIGQDHNINAELLLPVLTQFFKD